MNTWTRWAVAGALAVLGWAAPGARAAIILHVGSVNATQLPAIQTGFFDITIEATGVNPDLAAFQLKLDLTPPSSGVSFTGAVYPPTPIFNPILAPLTDFGSGPNTILVAAFLPSGSVPIVNGQALVRVNYQIDPNVSGVFNTTIDLANTILVDPQINTIDFTVQNGQINIVGGSGPTPIPLPMLLPAGLVLGGMLMVRHRRRCH